MKQCIKRILDDRYLSKEEVEQTRQAFFQKEKSFMELQPSYLAAIFSDKEIEELAQANEENLAVASIFLNWNEERTMKAIQQMGTYSTRFLTELLKAQKLNRNHVIQLYQQGIISLDTVKEIQNYYEEALQTSSKDVTEEEKERLNDIITTHNISELIQFENLFGYYNEWSLEPENQDKKDDYTKYLALYQSIGTKENESERTEENSTEIAAYIIDNSKNDDDCEKAILNFYHEGIITIHTIAELYEQEYIIELCKKGYIAISDIELLTREGYLPASYLNDIYIEKILNPNLSEEERVNLLLTGFVSKEQIGKLFQQTLISREDLKKLVEAFIITEEEQESMIKALDIEKALKSTGISFAVVNEPTKIHVEIDDDSIPESTLYPNSDSNSEKNKRIIHPEKREEFFRALGAVKTEVNGISEDNPFYHYQFYYLPEKDGTISINTPLIAERYYEDKETEEQFATGNATYFFQVGDFLVLNHYLKKDEVVEQKENVVFRSTHTLAGIRDDGNWRKRKLGNERHSKHS